MELNQILQLDWEYLWLVYLFISLIEYSQNKLYLWLGAIWGPFICNSCYLLVLSLKINIPKIWTQIVLTVISNKNLLHKYTLNTEIKNNFFEKWSFNNAGALTIGS